MPDEPQSRADTRAAIVEAAAALLDEAGQAAVTTRAVALRAGVQAPTIYRHFGDKDGLLDAVTEHVMAAFVSSRTSDARAAEAADLDPVEDLCTAWHQQVAFGTANPAVFRLLSAPDRAVTSPAARSGRTVLEGRVHRVAATGRLQVSERRAVDLVQAAAIGTIQALLSTPAEHRDPQLAETMLESVLGRVLTGTPRQEEGGVTAPAIALRALAPRLGTLSAGERALLGEWLDRVTGDPTVLAEDQNGR